MLSEQEAVARVLPSVLRISAEDRVGSGVILRSDGLGVTNAHVVEKLRRVEVRLSDGRTLSAEVTRVDREVDLALLQIAASALPAARLSDVDFLRLGESLVTIGYALDLRGGPTVTRGLYSAQRIIDEVDYIQTDAAMNRGNSGGPLISLKGEVVGICTWRKMSDQGRAVQGVNFAISASRVRQFLAGAAAKHPGQALPPPAVTSSAPAPVIVRRA